MSGMLKKQRGVITAFVSLMLVSILSLGTLVIEASRFQAAKNQLEEATVSAGTSMIASYNSELYNRYGLLAIDTEEFTESRCRDYLDFNADMSPSFFGNRVSRLYAVSDMELQKMYNLTYPSVLQRQILSRAKYHVIPQDYALNLYNIDSFFTDLKNKCTYVANSLESVANGTAATGSIGDVDTKMLSALTSLYNTFKNVKKYDDKCKVILTDSTVELLPSTTGTVESTPIAEDTQAINDALADAASVLGSAANLASAGTHFSETDVVFDADKVSNMTEDIKAVAGLSNVSETAKKYASNIRSVALSVYAAIDLLSSDDEGNLLLNSYITEYFSNRNYTVNGYSGPGKNVPFSGDNANFAGACVEYIFGGSADEKINQEKAYNYILAIRLINNLYSVVANSHSYHSDNEYSTLAHIAWGYYETCADMQLLTNYTASVPLNKYNMILNVNSCDTVDAAFASHNFELAMKKLGVYSGVEFVVAGTDSYSYKDSLALALWLVPNSKKMSRIADLIQIEMRYREQYVESKTATFLMSEQNTYCRIKCSAKLNSLLPIITMGTNSGINGISFSAIKYAGY